jgi:hypothetical protein
MVMRVTHAGYASEAHRVQTPVHTCADRVAAGLIGDGSITNPKPRTQPRLDSFLTRQSNVEYRQSTSSDCNVREPSFSACEGGASRGPSCSFAGAPRADSSPGAG